MQEEDQKKTSYHMTVIAVELVNILLPDLQQSWMNIP